VVAGLAVGDTVRRSLSAPSRIALTGFWEYASFGVNTFLFLCVGLATSPSSMAGHLGQVLITFVCMTGGRMVAIYLPFLLLRFVRPADAVPLRWQHVFVAGNIKGALSIALALALPASLEGRALLVDVAIGVTFLSMVGQGLLLPTVIRRLGLSEEDPAAKAIAEAQGRFLAARAAQQELEALHAQGLVPRHGYDQIRSDYQVAIAAAERRLRELQQRHLAQGARLHLSLRRRLMDAERIALAGAKQAGMIQESSADGLLAELDRRVLELEQMLAGGSPGSEEKT
jgi:CPA1 family monovalent cation:H+ antiporter